MAKRLSRRKNILKRKSLKRNSLRRKTLRRKSIKKRGGVPGKEFLTRNANKLFVGSLKNCSDVFLANGGNYPHIDGVSFDEENQKMRYDLKITLNWSEMARVPAEKIVAMKAKWNDHNSWRQWVWEPVSRNKVYNANKSYSELYSDCDMEGIHFFTRYSGKIMKKILENSFDFKKNKDEECKRRFRAIETVVKLYETEMNNLLKDDINLPWITKDLSSLGWTELTPQISD